MSARETILGAVRAAQPLALPLDAVAREVPRTTDDAAERLREVLIANGASVVDGRRSEIADIVRSVSRTSRAMLSEIPEVKSTLSSNAGARDLADLDLFIAEATLGVAECGALWLPQSRIGKRPALFLAEHVVIVLDRAAVVSDLHAAYERLDLREAFGTFVAGPSKTADIEQALVIGAHGPKRFTLILVEADPAA